MNRWTAARESNSAEQNKRWIPSSQCAPDIHYPTAKKKKRRKERKIYVCIYVWPMLLHSLSMNTVCLSFSFQRKETNNAWWIRSRTSTTVKVVLYADYFSRCLSHFIVMSLLWLSARQSCSRFLFYLRNCENRLTSIDSIVDPQSENEWW